VSVSGVDPKRRLRKAAGLCTQCGENPAISRTMCEPCAEVRRNLNADRSRRIKSGEHVPRPRVATVDQFTELLSERIEIGQPDECWPWTGSVDTAGYPNSQRVPVGLRRLHADFTSLTVRPHRWLAAVVDGLAHPDQIPEGMYVHHKCKNLRCCNSAHLEIRIKEYVYDRIVC
jgi:HNH endonuclease